MEAMSKGAVVVTTDGPPMNEFITDKRCLVDYNNTRQQNLATNYYVDPNQLESIVKELFKLPEKELRKIGQTNRKAYLKRKKEFQKNLDTLMKKASQELISFEPK